jgi:transketolase
MEGVGSEAASLAAHLGLDNLCWICDNNHITIKRSTGITFTEDSLPTFDRTRYAQVSGFARGAYVLGDAPGGNPEIILIASAIEQASTFGWERFTGYSGRIIGMKTFGASAPLKELQREFGLEPEHVVAAAKKLLGRS